MGGLSGRFAALFQDYVERWVQVQAPGAGQRRKEAGFVMICGSCAEKKAQAEAPRRRRLHGGRDAHLTAAG